MSNALCISVQSPTLVAPGTPLALSPDGFRIPTRQRNGQFLPCPQQSPIIKFVNSADDSAGAHTAICIDDVNFVYPPNTLFTVVGVQVGHFEYNGTEALLSSCRSECGGAPDPMRNANGQLHISKQQLAQWIEIQNPPLGQALVNGNEQAWDYFHTIFLPPGTDSSIYSVRQDLLTVQATYLVPAMFSAENQEQSLQSAIVRPSLKHTAEVGVLSFAGRLTYIRGVSEIIFARPLTMQEEWARDHVWSDWQGKSFSGMAEWSYVWDDAAVENRGGVQGFDQGHAGWRLQDFHQQYADLIGVLGVGIEFLPTLEEIAAARMYTGPAYVVLNGFMRQVGGLESRHWRARLAQLKHFSYSSTVFHLINAITKITKIAALQETNQEEYLLYRGVRGKLPSSFYEPDVQGFVTAVDAGFQSTSSNREVTVGFMDTTGPNVLWVLHCSHGSDTAGQLHTGAVLQSLSQFPSEAETLLPPLCMLQALRKGGGRTGDFLMFDRKQQTPNGGSVEFKEIHVRPCFA